MRSTFDLFTSNGKQCIIVIVEQGLFRFATSLAINTFSHQQRWRVLLQCHGPYTAGDKWRGDVGTVLVAQVGISDWTGAVWCMATGFDNSSQVSMATTAAPANDIHTKC